MKANTSNPTFLTMAAATVTLLNIILLRGTDAASRVAAYWQAAWRPRH